MLIPANASILGRLLLRVIDYQNGSGSLLQLQLQSQLPAEGFGKRKRAVRIGCATGAGLGGNLSRTRETILQNADCAKLSVKS